MSSDNISQKSAITVISLADTVLHGSLMSYELIQMMESVLQENKKVLCIYNRRGSARLYLCEDCGHQAECPYCNIHLRYHTTPSMRLLCHQCNYTTDVYTTCPKCGGHHITPVGIGIQKIESELQRIFQKYTIIRIDSDAKKGDILSLQSELQYADIVLGTQSVLTTLDERIGLVAFLLIDNDLALPEYDMEEKIYDQITYAKRLGVPVLIQTYAPESDFLGDVLYGNFKSFLARTLAERKQFQYPPYGMFLTLWVHHSSQEGVRDIIHKLVNKIHLFKSDDIFCSYDRDIWEKFAGDWRQKIILKGKDLHPLLEHIHTEIVRNRSVYIERH